MVELPDKESYQKAFEAMRQKLIDQDAVKYLNNATKWAFDQGWRAGQQALIDQAKLLVEVKEREQVDGLILGGNPDEIPF